MSFQHRFWLVVGIATLLVTAEAVRPSSTAGHQLPEAGIRSAPSINRALKGDKLLVVDPRAAEPDTAPVSRPDVRGPDSKIGCERPFSAMVSVRSDVAGRCIASVTRTHSSMA